MKYFEKIAVGPPIQLTTFKDVPTGALFIKNKEGKTRIFGNVGKDTYPWMKGSTVKSVKKHELVHYLRSKNKKWSALNSRRNPVATFVEEFAAYKRQGKNIGRSTQGALATATRFKGPLFKMLKAIK
jgi:hypothetical protein